MTGTRPRNQESEADMTTLDQWLGWKIGAEWPYEPSGRGVDVTFVKASR
jgi:hypothetical protein